MVLKWCWDMLVGTGSHAAPSAMQCYTGSAGSKLAVSSQSILKKTTTACLGLFLKCCSL